MQRSKAETYLGFCIRAGKLVCGVNAAACTKGVYLLVADKRVAKNSLKEIYKLKEKFSCPLVFAEDLERIVGKANCKLAAVKDQSLASAILNEAADGEPAPFVKGSDTKESENRTAESSGIGGLDQ